MASAAKPSARSNEDRARFFYTGAAVLIPGISVSGSGNAGLLVRAAGPALAKFGSDELRKELLALARAAGAAHPAQVSAHSIEILDGRFGAEPLASDDPCGPRVTQPVPKELRPDNRHQT